MGLQLGRKLRKGHEHEALGCRAYLRFHLHYSYVGFYGDWNFRVAYTRNPKLREEFLGDYEADLPPQQFAGPFLGLPCLFKEWYRGIGFRA